MQTPQPHKYPKAGEKKQEQENAIKRVVLDYYSIFGAAPCTTRSQPLLSNKGRGFCFLLSSSSSSSFFAFWLEDGFVQLI